jgi:hypothetical protein
MSKSFTMGFLPISLNIYCDYAVYVCKYCCYIYEYSMNYDSKLIVIWFYFNLVCS